MSATATPDQEYCCSEGTKGALPMNGGLFATSTVPVEYLSHTKAAVAVVVLASLWAWETWLPLFERRDRRLRHAGRNLFIALINTLVLSLAFGTGITFVADWSQEQG